MNFDDPWDVTGGKAPLHRIRDGENPMWNPQNKSLTKNKSFQEMEKATMEEFKLLKVSKAQKSIIEGCF